MLYKMDLLCIDESLFSVVNIRMNLDQHSWSSRHKKIMRRVEKRFAVTYGHANQRQQGSPLPATQVRGFIHNHVDGLPQCGVCGHRVRHA